MIKIIYGNNGTGKSKYYEQRNKDPNIRCLNYDIEKWYSEDKKISEERYKNAELKSELDKLKKNFFYKNNKIFGDITEAKMRDFLNHNKLFEIKDWLKLEKKNIKDIKDIDLKEILEIYHYFDVFKISIDELDDETFEILKIYSQFNYEKIDNLNYKKPIEFQKQIQQINKELEKHFTDKLIRDHLKQIKKIKSKNLDKLRHNKFNRENLLDCFKYKVINNSEFRILIDKHKLLEENKTKCINFSKYEKIIAEYGYNVSKDGFLIENIDLSKEKYSSGQKVVIVLSLLFDIFKTENNLIILDDVLEKLDIFNSVEIIRKILELEINNKEFNIEILTHDLNTISLIKKIINEQDVVDRRKINFREINSQGGLSKFNHSCNFNDYTNKIYNSISNEKEVDDKIKLHFFFSKLFNRSEILINFTQTNTKLNSINKNEIKESIQYKNFEFLSENIFHYSEKINLNKIPDFRVFLINKKLIKRGEVVDTVKLYEILIDLFKDEKDENAFGVNLHKISEYLKEMLYFIKKEKEYFEENRNLYNNEKKRAFFKKINLSNEEKTRRNNLFHNLEYSLIFINHHDNKNKSNN